MGGVSNKHCLLTFFIVTHIVGVSNCSMVCCSLLYAHSSFAIILMGKRELVALLSLSSWCLVMVVWLLHAVPWVCLRLVIVDFPNHTHLLILCVCVGGGGSVPVFQRKPLASFDFPWGS